MKRRQFLASSTASLGLASVPLSSVAFSAFSLDNNQPVFAIADEVLPTNREFVEVCRLQRTEVHTFNSDVTSLWVNTLAPAMNKSAPVIVGSTSATCLHCLSLLAARLGYFLDYESAGSLTNQNEISASVFWVLKPTRRTLLNLTA